MVTLAYVYADFQRPCVGKRFGKIFWNAVLFIWRGARTRTRKRVCNERIMSSVRYRVLYISFYGFYVYRVNRRVRPLIVSHACNINSCVRTVRRRGGTFSFVAAETNTRCIRIYDMVRQSSFFYFKYERVSIETLKYDLFSRE